MDTELVVGRPHAALRSWIAWYAGYRFGGLPPGTHRGLPSPYLTLIFAIDEPVVVGTRRHDTLIAGLHSAPTIVTHDGGQSGIQLALHPLGARALLGLPAGELAGLDLDATQILGPAATEAGERIRLAGGWTERFAVLDEVLLRCAGLHRTVAPEVGYAWQRLIASRGAIPIAELADEVGWSPRHLGGRFHAEIGLSPKRAARVIRFDHARRLLQRQAAAGEVALAELAADCGYYDQAHLAREFSVFAGCPPSQWLAEEFRYVQAAHADALTG